MKMRVIVDEGCYKPIRAHKTDAGLDILSPVRVDIPPMDDAVIHTGVHVELPPNTSGHIISKSGLNVNHSVTSTGLIDEGFQGEIIVKLYNHDAYHNYTVLPGDKITQLVVLPTLYPELEFVDEFDVVTDRGSDGYGSTGR